MNLFKTFTVASALALAAGGASAAVVDGTEFVVDNGDGTVTLFFDIGSGDVQGTGDGIIYDLGGGLTVLATSTGVDGNVYQDLDPDGGGLGVEPPGTDNLEISDGEAVTLMFNQIVDIVSFSLNGETDNDGHSDTANGGFTALSGGWYIDDDASNWDIVGEGTACDDLLGYCNTTSISFFADAFTPTPYWKGYIESITVSAQIPVPAAGFLLLGGLGGLAALRRRKKA